MQNWPQAFKMNKKKLEVICPKNQAEWRKWLEENHAKKDGVGLIAYKKSSGISTVLWGETVDEALCFGWIDSVRRPIDEEKYMQYFGKRKATSTWSKINKQKIELLSAKGMMTEAGLKAIEVAKENGSWTILDEVEALIIPDDLSQELNSNPGAESYFLSLSKSRKKMLLQWIVLAKRPETRKKRIKEITENATENRVPKQFR